MRHGGFREGASRRIPGICEKRLLLPGARDTVAGVRSPGRFDEPPAGEGHPADAEAAANGTGQTGPSGVDIAPSGQNAAVEQPAQAEEVPADPAVTEEAEERLDLARVGWLVTVAACLIAVVVLLVQGYSGYALVTFAVAVSAAINLT
jgi:hypothetical protein